MFVCERGYSCCNHRYWDNQEDVEQDAKDCDHLIEVEPVRRGHWIEAEDGDGVVCSECGTDFCTLFYRREDLKHCICGAKMDL